MTGHLLVDNIGTLATMVGTPDDALGRVKDACVLVEDGRVVYAGPRAKAPPHPPELDVVDAEQGAVLPGLIDCHTHLVWAGSRIDELELRSKGASYAEIMAAGGGIRSTMRAVRTTSTSGLAGLLRERLDKMLARGVTTVEVKSGYGLNLDDEVRSLYAVRRLALEGPQDLVPTCLAAHAVPPEHEDDRAGYVRLIVDEILPRVAGEELARFVDVFVERGAFTVDDARVILEAARALGLGTRVHAEQLSWSGGARLAAELSATAVGHLEHVTDDDIRALAERGVVCEVLASAQVHLGLAERVPGRRLVDGGCTVAVATDANPGSAPSLDLHLAGALAVSMAGLTTDEALLGMTKNAARALALDDRGVVAPGMRGDLVVLGHGNPCALFAAWGENPVRVVVKDGWVVHRGEGR